MPLPQPTSTGVYAKRTAHIRGNQQEILDLLDALMKPATVSITHCPGRQKGKDLVGNSQAEQMAPRMDIQEPILFVDLQETPTEKWDRMKRSLKICWIKKKRTEIASHPTNYYQENMHTRRENYTPQEVSQRLIRPNTQMNSFRGLIEQWKVCQQRNAHAAKSKHGKRPRRQQPRV